MLSTTIRVGLLVFVAGALIPSPATACSAQCPEAIGCYGGCTVNAPPGSGCGDMCFGACKLTCKLIGAGPGQDECNQSTSVDCGREGGGQEGIDSRVPFDAVEWAVVQAWGDNTSQLASEDVVPVASSSRHYGERAAEEVRQQINESRPGPPGGPASKADAAPGRRARSWTLRVGKGSGPIALESELLLQEFPFAVEPGAGIYVRGRTDGTGVIADLDVLYSRRPELTDELRRFVLNFLRVTGPERPGVPLGFFAYVGAAGEVPTPVALLVGGRELPGR